MLPLVAVALALLLLGTWLLAAMVQRVGSRAQAQSAADAAALAGVVEGEQRAAKLSAVNGGRLVAYERGDQSVTVTVEVDGVRATASAELSLRSPDG